MGCDIHLFVEKRNLVSGKWESVPEPPVSRNYSLFAILADVRNHFGFAGVDLGDPYNVIAPPRGLPADVSRLVRREFKSWGLNAHTPSWFTLEELLNFDWTQLVECRRRLSFEQFFKWAESGYEGEPRTSLIGHDSDDCITMEEAEIMVVELRLTSGEYVENEAAFLEEHKGAVILVKWQESYNRSASDFWSESIPVLLHIAGDVKHASDVRIVFWFDN